MKRKLLRKVIIKKTIDWRVEIKNVLPTGRVQWPLRYMRSAIINKIIFSTLFSFQFAAWVDAVIFVFSLENEASFNAVYNFYTKMSHFRNSSEIPIILVGTQGERPYTALFTRQVIANVCDADVRISSNSIECNLLSLFFSLFRADAISEHNPRIIDEIRARKLANDLKRCAYYETCATYGLNVECVFQEACQKIVQQRLLVSAQCSTPTSSRPTTPQGTRLGIASFQATQQPLQPPPPPQSNGFGHNSHLNSSASSNSNTILVNSGSMQSTNNFTLPHR